MDANEKLFKKLSEKDRTALRVIISDLVEGRLERNVKKLRGSDFHRLRKGRFRIIFHYAKNNEVVVDSIRLRDERTYKDF